MLFGSLNILRIPAVKASAQCRDVIDYFVHNADVRLLAVVNAENLPIGAISRTKIIVKAAGQYGRALYDKQPIKEFIDPPRFVVVESQDIAEIAGQLAHADVTAAPDGYILVDTHGIYCGVIDGLEVLRAVMDQNTRLISTLSDEIRVRSEAEQEARRLANTDVLTGLCNRRVFIEHAEKIVESGTDAVLVYLDLDRFKALNDKFGHAVGDDALKATAQRLKAWRPGSFLARLGGDEFGLLLPNTRIDSLLLEQLDDLYRAICAPFVSAPGAVNVGASIGAAGFPADANGRAEWFHAADKAMQRAKAEHGGVQTFDPKIDFAQAKQARLTEALRHAVSESQIRPYFQPFVNVASGQVEGYEVLARWYGPDIGFTPGPSEFIPIAERLGLIDEMFWQVADQAMAAFSGADPRLKIALNVSPIQFSNLLFPARLAAIASRHGVRFNQVEIEITETAMFRDMGHTVDMLRHLNEMGVSIALDDFGTGYSSLTLVKELPLTKLKIDKSFVQTSGQAASSEKILAAAIGLGKALGVTCCAEGVEDTTILAKLKGLHCELAQGYLFGAPLPGLVLPASPTLKAVG